MPHKLTFLLLSSLALCSGSEKATRVQLADTGRAAAPAAVARPVLGFAFDESASGLRAIFGVPGAAILGHAVPACGQGLQNVAISPGGDYLIGNTRDGARLILCRNPGDEAVSSVLDGAPAGAARILLSPRGAVAVLYDAATRRTALVRGLPDSPAISDFEISDPDATLLAVSDNGAILAATPRGNGEVLLLLSAAGQMPVGSVGHAAAARFLIGRDEAIVADSVLNATYLAGTNGIQTLAAEREGLKAPSAVAVSADNRQAFIANSGGEIARLSLNGGVPSFTNCNCQIAGMERLGGNAVFRILSSASTPVLVYDGDALPARVVVIPPDIGGISRDAGRNPGNGRAR